MIFQFVFLKTYILYTITVSLWIASHTMRDWLPWVQTDFQRLTSRWFQFTDYCKSFYFFGCFLIFRFWFENACETWKELEEILLIEINKYKINKNILKLCIKNLIIYLDIKNDTTFFNPTIHSFSKFQF